MRTRWSRWLGCLALTALTAGAAPADAPRWERPPELQASARLFESWKPAVPPRPLLGNIHYVGTRGIACYLVTTPAGHVLIDTGFDDTADQLLAAVEALGFRPADIRLILSSHAHVDHVGGHARVQRRTGAKIVASAADARLLASGGADDFSPFPRPLMLYPPATADRIVADGEQVSLGGVTLTAHLTPGHTAGATTWSTTVSHDGRTYAVVFLSSLSLVQGTRLLGNPRHPQLVADYEQAFRRLATISCDVFFGFHVSASALEALPARLRQLQSGTGPNPFHDPRSGWKAQLESAEQVFRSQLAAEEKAHGASR